MRGINTENTGGASQNVAANLSADLMPAESLRDRSLPATNSCISKFLDQSLPLHEASHAAVVSYSVEIPMRYAKCFANLNDGRKVAFQDSRLFVGWLGWIEGCSLLFRTDDLQIELRTNPEHAIGRQIPGNIREIIVEMTTDAVMDDSVRSRNGQRHNYRKFIAIDGSQIVLSSRG